MNCLVLVGLTGAAAADRENTPVNMLEQDGQPPPSTPSNTPPAGPGPDPPTATNMYMGEFTEFDVDSDGDMWECVRTGPIWGPPNNPPADSITTFADSKEDPPPPPTHTSTTGFSIGGRVQPLAKRPRSVCDHSNANRFPATH